MAGVDPMEKYGIRMDEHGSRRHSPAATVQSWCAALLSLHSAADGMLCDTVFNRSVLHHADSIPRREVLSHLGWDRVGQPSFVSSGGQDWWLYHNYARWAQSPGLFIDLATNDPLIRSNTYFLEKCLGWKGVCIEPLPSLHSRIRSERSCELVPRCIAAKPGAVTFWSATNNTGGASKVINATAGLPTVPGSAVIVKCEKLQDVLDRSAAFRAAGGHVQLLSLDVEGHEMSALSSIDWSRTTIDIIITEGGQSRADREAVQRHLTTELGLYHEILNTGTEDRVYVRRSFAFGPVAPGQPPVGAGDRIIDQQRWAGPRVPRAPTRCHAQS